MVRAPTTRMKSQISNFKFQILILLALTGWAAADLPKKAPITNYTRLWTESPFTSKPPPEVAGPVADPLEDYSLAGVSPVTGGYRVTLLNKKNPTERIIVESDRPSAGFKILGVTRKPGDPLGTVVRMSSGSVTGNVAFDEKLLALAPPAAPAAQAGPKPPQALLPGVAPGNPPGVSHGAAPVQPGQVPSRQPRPRVVPPATPTQPVRPGPRAPSNLRRDQRSPR